MLAAKHRWQDNRLTVGKPLEMFRPLKVWAVAFKSFESIAGCCRLTGKSEIDILTPPYLDQTMEEFLRLSIQRRQRELDCVAAGGWAPVDKQKKWAVDYNLPKDWMVRLRRGDVVIGRAMPPKIFDHIWRISECGPKLNLEIRGAVFFAHKIKGFQKLSLVTVRNENFFSEILP